MPMPPFAGEASWILDGPPVYYKTSKQVLRMPDTGKPWPPVVHRAISESGCGWVGEARDTLCGFKTTATRPWGQTVRAAQHSATSRRDEWTKCFGMAQGRHQRGQQN